MAWLYFQKRDYIRALDLYRQAFSLRDRLAHDDPANPAKLAAKAVAEAGIGYASLEMAARERGTERRTGFCREGEYWSQKALPELKHHRPQLGGDEANFIDLLQDAAQPCRAGG